MEQQMCHVSHNDNLLEPWAGCHTVTGWSHWDWVGWWHDGYNHPNMRTHFRSMHVCLCKVPSQSTFPQHEQSKSRDYLMSDYISACIGVTPPQRATAPPLLMSCLPVLQCTIVPALEGVIYADRSRDWMWATNFSLISPDTGTRDLLRVTVSQWEADTRAQSQ